MVWTHCKDHDERYEKGSKQVIFAQKYDVALELEEGTGLAMSWTSLQSLEVGAGSGSMSWLRVGKGGTKQYCMALQAGRK